MEYYLRYQKLAATFDRRRLGLVDIRFCFVLGLAKLVIQRPLFGLCQAPGMPDPIVIKFANVFSISL